MPPDQLNRFQIGQVLRLSSPKKATPDFIGELANFYAATHRDGSALVTLDRGINTIRSVKTPAGQRAPAIIISSSPHKIGTEGTPWQDHFESDSGHIRFYGDNKKPGEDPSKRPGNAALLRAFEAHSHHDPAVRRRATPLLFFKRVPREGKPKGFVEFHGFGIVTSVELVSQFSERAGGTFSNYAFDFLVMTMTAEHETFDWNWISARRDPSRSDSDCLAIAPAAWKDWVANGEAAVSRVRRRVSKLRIEAKERQLPPKGSPAAKALAEVYAYYDKSKHDFEALASIVAQRVICPSEEGYKFGGLTKQSGDGGIDFVARYDVGSGFDGAFLGPARLVVLGQAKCERPDRNTHGNAIARTVARLRRGWLGVYVTTSYFSKEAQREVIEDRYPILLINGRRVGEEVHKMTVEQGGSTVKKVLEGVDDQRVAFTEMHDPEDILTW
jgi:hypothetical protein